MKATYYLFLVLLGLYACSARPADDAGAIPQDLESLNEVYRAKQKELRELQKEIKDIEARIAEIDPSKAKQSRVVEVGSPDVEQFKRFARIQGAVMSKNTVTITPEVPGRITKITVDEGSNVNRGQLIASIDVEQLRKQKAELEKSLELAQDVYIRQERLWNQQIGSEMQYLEAKNSVERLEQSIETVDHQISKANIYSPITGVVDMTNLEVGEYAQPGVPIVIILDTRNVKVVADVPESYLGTVKKGEQVEVIFPALADTATYPLTMIGRKIDPANRTFKIEIDLLNKGGMYKPNLLAEVLVNDYVLDSAVVVTQTLVQQEVGGREFVMVVGDGDDGKVARKAYVRTGESYAGRVVISDGLTGDEALITNGARTIANGEKIRIINSQDSGDEE